MEGLVKRFSNCGACPLGGVVGPVGGARVFCMRDIFILDEIWTQDKIYILAGTLLGLNILLTTQYRYWVRTLSSTFCRRLKLAFFVATHRLVKMKWHCCPSSYYFWYYYAEERNYCTLGFLFIYRVKIPCHFPSCVVRNLLYSKTYISLNYTLTLNSMLFISWTLSNLFTWNNSGGGGVSSWNI
jgi:hypothetical protein